MTSVEVPQLSPEAKEEWEGGFDGQDLEFLRDQVRASTFLLSKGVLGFKDVSAEVHGGFCLHFEGNRMRRRLGLMPRAHLKSTIGTVADSLRLGIAEPNHTRVLIAGETSTLSEKFLAQIKGHVEKNELLRGLFPELIPPRFQGQGITWSSTQASLVRSAVLDSPTWQAIGVGGAVTGNHFTRIKCDDLIGFEALRSAAAMAQAKAWVDSIEPLLVDQNESIIDFIGTRWSRNDLYAHIMEGYGDGLSVYTRSAIEDGEIIFPALHNWEEYERIQRINPALWAAQYENNPLSVVNGDFPVDGLRHFRFNYEEQSVTLQSGKRWQLEELDIVLTADPNSGSVVAPDTAAAIVSGLSPEDEVVVLDAWSGRVSPSDFVNKLYQMARRWKPRVAGIEKAGQQNTDHYFQLKAEQENLHIRVTPLQPGTKQSKEDRVRGSLEPLIRSGLLHLLPSQSVLRQQISEFPDCLLWDELDALAMGTRLWRKPVRKEVIEKKQGAIKKLLSLRNPITGY